MATVDRIAALRAAEAQVESLTDTLDKELAPLIEQYISYLNKWTPKFLRGMPTKGWSLGHSNVYCATVEGDHINIHAYYAGDDSDLEMPLAYIENPSQWMAEENERRNAKLDADYQKTQAEKEAQERAELDRLKAIYEPKNPERAEAH